ncbi:MAG: Uncharacterized protein XD76_1728 [candidate division TA06 bacterium 32_111]|uniref:Transporter n=2 Tax=Bacteria candidate phyla TaxID=1783234 RepID=A0A101I176_UNCT6|nr:MAG: Uncharacterized protein XD76_1728 [candidate division TA06 bacterium 32_111]KUK86519.1 MAG: Uncharacterized protein XE03_1469 [candidate division TA06 bacterium 34_109]HAF08261.1 hypothetical protein [candidate division WOR-3 bacterium]HCP17244.1 hypothetical protein [candidate division WOR-3 bacterium]
MKKRLKQLFISGILVIVPLFVTIIFVTFIISKLGGFWGFVFKNIPYIKNLPVFVINFIGFILSLILIIVLGYIGEMYIGRYLISFFENFFLSTPFVKNIYMPTKEIVNQLFQQRKKSFKRVVFVHYFNKEMYTIGFVTNDEKWFIDGEEALSIFIPTSPNPTSGFYAVIKKKDVIETDFTLEEAFNIIVTSGLFMTKNGEIDGRKVKRDS